MSDSAARTPELVLVTGMSGAGRSTAARALEDMGWFVIDNLPSSIIPRVGELVASSGTESQRVALIAGRRGTGESIELLEAIDRGDYSGLDARGVAAMRLAEAMVDARKGIPDEIFAELKRCFAVNEIVELVSLVGIMELACSLAEVFELDAD